MIAEPDLPKFPVPVPPHIPPGRGRQGKRHRDSKKDDDARRGVGTLILFFMAHARVRGRLLVKGGAAGTRRQRDAAVARGLVVLPCVRVLFAPGRRVFGREAADEGALAEGVEFVVVVAARGVSTNFAVEDIGGGGLPFKVLPRARAVLFAVEGLQLEVVVALPVGLLAQVLRDVAKEAAVGL